MNILLIYPSYKYISGDPPLGIGYIAAIIRKHFPNFNIKILDTTFMTRWSSVYNEILRYRPDIVGISVNSLHYPRAYRIAKFCKEHGIFTIVGGPHVTVAPNSFSGAADLGIIGEGEITIVSILENFSSKNLAKIPGTVVYSEPPTINPTPKFIDDLDSLPIAERAENEIENYIKNFMYFDGLDFNVRGTTMIASRGCPYQCTYCQPTLRKIFGTKIRKRSPESIYSEIQFLKKKYNINAVFFHDDTLFFDPEWSFELINYLGKARIIWGCNSRVDNITEELAKEAARNGLKIVHLGIESANNRIVNEIYKKNIDLERVNEVIAMLNRYGTKALGFFMFGAPDETLREIRKSIKFIKNSDLSEVSISITTPLPGTALFDSFKIKNDILSFDYYRGTPVKRRIPRWLLRSLQIYAFLLFYLTKKHISYIIRHLKSRIGMRRLLQKIRRYL